MTSYINMYGYTKTMTKRNDKIRKNEINWKTNYDGDDAHINVNVNENGKQNSYNIELTDTDIDKLLSIQPISQPLHERLMQDFYNPSSLDLLILPKKHNIIKRSNKKTKTNKKSKTNKKTNKNK